MKSRVRVLRRAEVLIEASIRANKFELSKLYDGKFPIIVQYKDNEVAIRVSEGLYLTMNPELAINLATQLTQGSTLARLMNELEGK